MKRELVRAGFLALAGLLFAAASAAAGEKHGLSMFGDLKYPPDFQHFDYVNPDAPKGGRVSQVGPGGTLTFDSFNNFILKGDRAQGLDLVYDTLMVRALDEPDAVYGLVAKSADVAADGMSVVFKLRSEAKFADGTPVTAEDVVFSFDALKTKGHPSYRIVLRDVENAEAIDPQTVKFSFKGDLIKPLPLEVAQLPVLPKAFYATRNFEETWLERPLGSGPYRVGQFSQGRYVSYERRDDYWAKDLPVNRGRFNFDEVRFDYFRDRTLELEALFANTIDFREEFTSKDWATGYDKPMVNDGRVVKLSLPDETPSGAQGFFLNTRRPLFQDVRVRQALDLAFDFEWSNRNLFFGLYQRTASFFENSDMKASGKPSADELVLLEPFRDQLPATVFAEVYVPPVTDGSGLPRENLRKAQALLKEAGWTFDPKDRVLKNAKGEPFAFEILLDAAAFERIAGPYVKNLKAIGINADMRRVDPAQFELRMKTFDFDMTIERFSLRLTPGIELKNFWGSEAAKTDGSFNLAGISNPAVDALADKIAKAQSRAELVTAARALDRVLRSGHYWVPHWFKAAHHLAFWNKFSWPEVKPKYDRGALTTWWYDPAKAAKLRAQ
ncbi:MAG: extracellular solute-binding protein [Deltaproteobacteria bacterium]